MSSPAEVAVEDIRSRIDVFFRDLGVHESLPDPSEKVTFISALIHRHLRVLRIERGRLTCSLSVDREIVNPYNTLHGGALAAAGEEMARACAMTVARVDHLFLGEGSASYLAAARLNETIEVDASIVRQGRRVIVSSVEFRSKESQKLLYMYRATFYALPAASL